MKKGFTLIELLVVVLVIGILAAIALPQYQTAIERSRATEALTLMNAVRGSLERYHAQHDTFPSAENDFAKLDVDIPCITSSNGTCTAYGGKYFTISFGTPNATTQVTVSADRRVANSYYLSTTITANDDGSYSAVRQCVLMPNATSDASDYCKAITGNHNNDF